MFRKFFDMIKNKEVRKRILFTLLIFIVYRFGCTLTIPGIDKTGFTITSDSVLSLMNLMGGGALAQFSIFALGVSPYITSSIVIQLLSMDVIPSLSEWRKDGEKGRKKIERATRFLSVVLAIIQGWSITYGFDKQYGILGAGATFRSYIFVIGMLVTGTMIISWLGDQISIKGVGNGMSMIIFAGIVSDLPNTFTGNYVNTVYSAIGTDHLAQGILHFTGFILLYLLIILVVTCIECGEKRISIHNSQTLSNGSTMTYLPVKINPAGVIPVIFAQTIMTVPQVIISFFNTDLYQKMGSVLSLKSGSGLAIYGFLIFLFTFLYTDIIMDPEEISSNLKKQGSFIPGVRPGKDTEKHLRKVIYRTATIGAVILTALGLLPYILSMFATVTDTTALGGTGIIVCVGVAMETINALETMQIKNRYSTGWMF